MFELSISSKRNRHGVDSRLIEISDLAIQITTVDFGIPQNGGLRTEETQKSLYAAGKSKADGVRNRSHHQSGRALDFFAFVNGHASWDEHHLAMVACAFLQAASMLGYSISWGGLWSNGFVDMPHIELN